MPQPFWSAGVRFECQQTGRCCTARYDGHGYVYVSVADRERLAAHFGLSVAELERRYCDTTAGLVHLKGPERDCALREGHRCGVYDARPTQCRTWPFWPEHMNRAAWAEVAAGCPGVGQGRLYTREEIEALLAEARAAMRSSGTPRATRGDRAGGHL